MVYYCYLFIRFLLPLFRNFRFEFVRLRTQPQISKAHDQIVLLQNSALYKFLNTLQKIQRLDMLLTTLFLSPSGPIDPAMHDLYGASKLRVQLSRIRRYASRLCPKRRPNFREGSPLWDSEKRWLFRLVRIQHSSQHVCEIRVVVWCY